MHLLVKILLVMSVLNALVVMNVEGIFFLDLLCATRIESLEKQVAQLVTLTQAQNLAASTQSTVVG